MSKLFLISDFHNGSYKIGLLKSKWLSIDQSLAIIDITHDIHLNNTIEAAFIGKHIEYADYQQTITHYLIGESDTILVYQHSGNVFILPNNGLISLLFENPVPANTIVMNKGDEFTTAIELVHNKPISKIPISRKVEYRYNRAINVMQNIIVAECIFIDKHGNCYFNIHQDKFIELTSGRNFNIKIQHYTGLSFNAIANNVLDVDPGDAVLCFSSTGFLKLQIHLGNAKQLFRIKEETKLTIELT